MSASVNCPLIHLRGRFFLQGSDRFFIRGVVYQLHGSQIDPISDDRLTELQDEILLFRELGLNTLLVYSIDSTKDHTQAMKLLEEAGIYVFVGVSTSKNCISRVAPTESYNPSTMTSFFQRVDAMAKFPNTLGLLAATELINNDDSMPVAAVLKAVVRDMKKYMKIQNEANGQRVLPIGYQASTVKARDREVLKFLTAVGAESSIDFWACNNYEWEKTSDVLGSGYDDMVHRFRNIMIPMFVSEYGNQSRHPRLFEETIALYSPAVTCIFSGGCVYEFWQSYNNYGLIDLLEHNSDQPVPWYREPKYDSKIFERRETDKGTLLIYKDFVNYKTKLAEIGDIEVGAGIGATEGEEEQGETATKISRLAQAEWRVPESCVDWGEMK